ncbi:MAG: HAD-IIB family hydrolase [Clostridia bacterium]|nr:HAD-IIB family hydrolase [Clostridia bacterium]
MKTLYISDMDGTLLQSNGKMSEFTKEKLNEFYNKGIPFSVATARSMISAMPILEGVHFAAPIVLMNGVFVYDTETKKAVKYHEIEHSVLQKILDLFYEKNLHPFMFLYSDDYKLSIKYTEFDNDGMKEFYDERVDLLDGRFTQTDDLTIIEKSQHPVYVNYYALPEFLDDVVEKLKDIPEIDFAYYKDSYSDDWLIEIYSHTASKANGAKEVKEIVGTDYITAFGDNLNDIIMLKDADVAVAVQNAVPQVKEIADIIIGNNNDNSVVNYIIHKENA